MRRIRRTFIRRTSFLVPLFLLFLLLFSSLQVSAQNWRARMHDPSSIVKCKDRYWTFGTGDGIHAMYSTDLITWSDGPSPFTKTQFPAWINQYVGGATSNGARVFHGGFWAPDIFFMNNQYYLYYSCSEWGTMTSTIGCVTNKTLDPTDPEYKWVDVGFLGIWSYQAGLALNAIDPAISRGPDGRIWMVYGSFNERGIVITELDSISGKPKTYAGNLPGKSIANSWTGPRTNDYAEGEGACMIYRDEYYYLFYNKGGCCAGINSSYYVVMGRSKSPTGPFYDKQGRNLRALGVKSGGTVVFKHDDLRGTDDRFFGPGHFGIFNENGTDYVSFHYYDPNWPYPGQPSGGPTLGLAKLVWGSDGWPTVSMNFVDKGVYTIKNANSNKLLGVQNHLAVNGALAYQYAANASTESQKWVLNPLGTGEYTLRNFADTTLYLEAAGAGNDDLLRLTANYTGAVNQKFRLIKSVNDKVIIYPSKSDKLFEIPYAFTADYQVKLWPNTNHNCQRWFFTLQDEAVATSKPQKATIKVFPNPASQQITIEGIAPMQIHIYNMSGMLVLEELIKENTATIDINKLAKAPYMLKATSNGEIIIKKLVKQ
jgi:arabinan endo-1,5-alpha-L-arabinosidase